MAAEPPNQGHNEAGEIPTHYPVQPLPGAGYKQRMVKNIEDSDATVIVYVADLESGTENTLADPASMAQALCGARRRDRAAQ